MFNQSDPSSRWKLGKALGKEVNMKKSLRILTILSFTAGSILFVTPSQAAVVGGVTVTVSGNALITSSSANKLILGGSGSSASDSFNFDFGGSLFSVASINELFFSNSFEVALGIPSTPEVGYNKTINMEIGYGYLAKADVFSGGSRIYQALCPSGNFTAPATCSGQKINRAFTPFIQLNYTASSGVLSVRVPVTSGTGSSITINTDGTFSLSSGTVTSWVELTNFVVGAGANTAPGAPTSVTATSTGATTANVSFTAPVSNGGAAITSYTATSSPGGITGAISQATSGTIAMTGLTAGTAYTFTVTATNSAGTSAASSASNSTTTVGAPTAPTSVVATATGKRSATVSFAAPASNGGSAVTSYTATSTPGGLTQTLTQATGGTFNFDGLQPATAYTFAVTATNAIGTSSAATSNSITTTPLVVASLSSLSFADDGTGTGGKIVWSGKSIDAVLYTGPANSYPGPYNYGAFTGGWNGRIRNLTPGTEYTVSLFVVSADGVGESKSLTFKTSATLPALAGAASATTSKADQMTAQLPKLFAWINENVFVDGEGDRMKMMLNKFDALVTSPYRSHIKVPTSRVLSVVATSLTPLTCSVVSATAKENAGLVKALSGDTCTISYTVSGGSRAPATMVKDFVFKKFAK
jgi:hypothetical protein